jgi:Zn-dependent protease
MPGRPTDPDARADAVFLEPNHTPYDLRWRMFGTDVRVHPLFWLISAALGWTWFSMPGGNVGYLALWVFCCFVSILLHEFGHVLVGRLFGSSGHIVLYSFGGLAVGSNNLRPRWQRVLVLLGGPGAQLLLWGGLWGALYLLGAAGVVGRDWVKLTNPSSLQAQGLLWPLERGGPRPLPTAVVMLFEINLFWPILNLLPVWPLDGGQITREVCEGAAGSRGTTVALGLSLLVSGLLAVHCFLGHAGHRLLPKPVPEGDLYLAFLFAVLAAGSYLTLQAESQMRRHWDDDSPWGR